MFIVADGELECVQTGHFVATYGAGQYFGELGLFQRPNESGVLPTRPVSVRGLSDESTVLQIWKHQLEAHPTIMQRLRPVRVQSCHLQAPTMRAELIGHFDPCMAGIYLHIDARMSDYIRTHPYLACVVALLF